ncbi:MAG: sugar phosphate isomerase/epimerase [Anaerolineae bacterium]|nr:sugar phosphate isomerase/epimerase [Anaerolineae bacterium]
MDFSIASYSFHRLLRDGRQDMFRYIQDCKDLGCAWLDPWNGHLEPLIAESEALKAAGALTETFSAAGLAYVAQVRAAADAAGLPFACLAVDGAHLYDPVPQQRRVLRAAAYRWLEVAVRLGAAQLRIDTGGTEDLPAEQFDIIVEGYHDLIARARPHHLHIVLENHWGASRRAANVVRILQAVPALGLLFDSNNFIPEEQEASWHLCAPFARAVHIKTFAFDADGNDPTVDIPQVVRLLVQHGYQGCWGIESVPRDGDEYGAVTKTMALIRRALATA